MKSIYELYIRRWMPYIPFLLFFLYSFVLHSMASMKPYDDYVYQTAWDGISILEWCKSFYVGWSGRVPLQMMDIIFLQFPIWGWRIWNAVLFATCPVLISKIGGLLNETDSLGNRFVVNSMLCGLFVLLPQGAMDGAVLWISGSFNYLLPCVGLLAALYPFFAELYDENVKKWEYTAAVLGTFFCCYAEQTAAIFLCLTAVIMLMLVIQKKKCAGVLCLELFGALNAAVLFLAPGNHERYVQEVPLWDKAYDMYSFLDKLLLGYVHCMRNLFLKGWVFILLILVLLFFAMRKRSLIYKGLFLLYSLFNCGMFVLLYRIEYEKFIFLIGNINSMIYLFLITVWLVLMAVFSLTAYESDDQFGILLTLLYLGAFAAGTVVAMSPSVFEAKLRVFFVPYIMLIFAIGLQMQKMNIK